MAFEREIALDSTVHAIDILFCKSPRCSQDKRVMLPKLPSLRLRTDQSATILGLFGEYDSSKPAFRYMTVKEFSNEEINFRDFSLQPDDQFRTSGDPTINQCLKTIYDRQKHIFELPNDGVDPMYDSSKWIHSIIGSYIQTGILQQKTTTGGDYSMFTKLTYPYHKFGNAFRDSEYISKHLGQQPGIVEKVELKKDISTHKVRFDRDPKDIGSDIPFLHIQKKTRTSWPIPRAALNGRKKYVWEYLHEVADGVHDHGGRGDGKRLQDFNYYHPPKMYHRGGMIRVEVL